MPEMVGGPGQLDQNFSVTSNITTEIRDSVNEAIPQTANQAYTFGENSNLETETGNLPQELVRSESNQQVDPEKSEDGPEEERREKLLRIFTDMADCGLTPVKCIQGGTLVDVYDESIGAESGRPFMVFLCAKPEEQGARLRYSIFKTRTEPDPNKDGLKEIIFLDEIAPWLQVQLPSELDGKVVFPEVRSKSKLGAESTFIEEDFIQGKICGNAFEVHPGVMTREHVDTVVGFLKHFHQELTLENLREVPLCFDRNSAYGNYEGYMNWEENPLSGLIGEEYYAKMRGILESNKTLIDEAPLQFNANDINPGNLVLQEEGKVGFVDWERAYACKDPARDYTYLFADLWNNPKMQEYYFHKVMDANKDTPNFKEYFRLNFLFSIAAAPINHFWWKMAELKPGDPELEKCRQAVRRTCQLVVDAVDQKGIWADGTPGEENRSIAEEGALPLAV